MTNNSDTKYPMDKREQPKQRRENNNREEKLKTLTH